MAKRRVYLKLTPFQARVLEQLQLLDKPVGAEPAPAARVFVEALLERHRALKLPPPRPPAANDEQQHALFHTSRS